MWSRQGFLYIVFRGLEKGNHFVLSGLQGETILVAHTPRLVWLNVIIGRTGAPYIKQSVKMYFYKKNVLNPNTNRVCRQLMNIFSVA